MFCGTSCIFLFTGCKAAAWFAVKRTVQPGGGGEPDGDAGGAPQTGDAHSQASRVTMLILSCLLSPSHSKIAVKTLILNGWTEIYSSSTLPSPTS